MISTVTIKNFQSHQDTTLSFSSGVNVIVGLSDTGKSAIFRALVWALFNRPLGDGFRSHWSDKDPTEVIINFSNGDVIRRIKGTGINEYHVNGTVLKAFGQDPPDEVLRVHKIDRTLNVQSQIDPFFLLQSSPGEVATYLNQIAGLDDIDRVTKGLQSHSRNLQRNLDSQSNIFDNLKSQLEQYQDLDLVGAQLNALEGLERELESLNDKRSKLDRIVQRINYIKRKLRAEAKRLKQVTPKLEQALQKQVKIQRLHESIGSLRKLIDAVVRAKYNIERTKGRLLAMEKQWHKAMPSGSECPLCGHIIVK